MSARKRYEVSLYVRRVDDRMETGVLTFTEVNDERKS